MYTNDKEDKSDASILFNPPIEYSTEVIEKGAEMVEVLNDSTLTDDEKTATIWEILK